MSKNKKPKHDVAAHGLDAALQAMTKPALRSGYASALAEADLARGRTTAEHGRVLELEAAVNDLQARLEQERIAIASTLVTLIRQTGCVAEVVKILGPSVGWHEATLDNCEQYT